MSSIPEGFERVEIDNRAHPLPVMWRGKFHPLLKHIQASVRWVYICLQDPDPKVMAKQYTYVRDNLTLPEGTDEGIEEAGESTGRIISALAEDRQASSNSSRATLSSCARLTVTPARPYPGRMMSVRPGSCRCA